jgi:dTDP-glucose 4,6-dehydratase
LDPADPTFTEESPLKPNSPYAATKAAGDLLVRAYHSSYGLPVLITRCGNNYGPYQFPEKFLPLLITQALASQPVPVYGDGQQIRDWIHVEDHARALLHVLEQGIPGEVYNISAGGERTNLFMAQTVLEMLNKPLTFIRHVTDRPGHDRRYGLNASKVRQQLGWRPLIELESGLISTVEWYQRDRRWWERVQTGEYKKYYNDLYADRLATTSIED